MIHSMTGVGKALAQYGGRQINVFIKTVNSKQLDISARLPQLYRERELDVRSLVAERLQRGKVELSISIEGLASELSDVQRINEQALAHYKREIQRATGSEDPSISLDALLRLPGVLCSVETSSESLSLEEWETLRGAVSEALDRVVAFRSQEGEMLEGVLRGRIENISALLSEVDQPESERIPNLRAKLEEALARLDSEAIDRGRLEQELIYYIEKLDINEEKDRLRHHLSYFGEVLSDTQAQQGKTLGFIAQEIGREINTLGSKSNNAMMQQLVIKMKDELEQIKEQVLNVL